MIYVLDQILFFGRRTLNQQLWRFYKNWHKLIPMWSSSSGSLSVPWDMKVSPVVSVPRGEDAVLGCSFTHPSQQKYSGTITAQWRARELNASPFFSCSLKNDSMEEPNKCSVSEFRYSLVGDPRRGELSLLIRRVNMLDNGTYFCKVKLDGWMSYFHKETQLYVTGEVSLTGASGSPLDLWLRVNVTSSEPLQPRMSQLQMSADILSLDGVYCMNPYEETTLHILMTSKLYNHSPL